MSCCGVPFRTGTRRKGDGMDVTARDAEPGSPEWPRGCCCSPARAGSSSSVTTRTSLWRHSSPSSPRPSSPWVSPTSRFADCSPARGSGPRRRNRGCRRLRHPGRLCGSGRRIRRSNRGRARYFLLFALGFLLVLAAHVGIARPLRAVVGPRWWASLVAAGGLLVALVTNEKYMLHDIGLFVFEAAWVALGYSLPSGDRLVAAKPTRCGAG